MKYYILLVAAIVADLACGDDSVTVNFPRGTIVASCGESSLPVDQLKVEASKTRSRRSPNAQYGSMPGPQYSSSYGGYSSSNSAYQPYYTTAPSSQYSTPGSYYTTTPTYSYGNAGSSYYSSNSYQAPSNSYSKGVPTYEAKPPAYNSYTTQLPYYASTARPYNSVPYGNQPPKY